MSQAQACNVVRTMGQMNALAHGPSKAYLGVELEDVTADKARALRLKESRGAVVTLIDHDAPAAYAGIEIDDVILTLDGKAVENQSQFWQMLYQYPAGQTVTIEISRKGELQTLTVELIDKGAVEQGSGTGLAMAATCLRRQAAWDWFQTENRRRREVFTCRFSEAR